MAVETDQDGNPLTLPFDPERVACVRMRQSEIARLFEVTPAAVSQWVKRGKITTFADGSIDPNKAASELAKNCDINRLRAKPFRPLRQEVEELRKRLRDLREERDQAVKQQANLADRLREALALAGEQSAWLDSFYKSLSEIPLDEDATLNADEWPAVIEAAFDAAANLAMARNSEDNVATAVRMLREISSNLEGGVATGCPPTGDQVAGNV